MKKTSILLIILAVFVLSNLAFAAPPQNKDDSPTTSIIEYSRRIAINRMEAIVTNVGVIGRDIPASASGTYYPAGSNTTCNYATGMWLGGMVDGQLRTTVAEFAEDYTPGPIGANPSDQDHRIYAIRRTAQPGDSEYEDWMWNSGQSDIVPQYARPPIKEILDENGLGTGEYEPDFLGDQALWCIYNDMYETGRSATQGTQQPLGLEVRQTAFAFNQENPLGYIIFIKYQIYNKGGNNIENCYLSIWSDPDLGGANDDLIGVDKDISLGYCYNGDNDDLQYNDRPPVFGVDFFQGPVVPSEGGRAKFFGEWIDGYENLQMSSFNRYTNGTDPNESGGAYFCMQGLTRAGEEVIHPITGEVTTFFFDGGDPVSNTGWIDTDPNDRRMMQTVGPWAFAADDSQEVVVAFIVGQGTNRLTSISMMRYYDLFAQSAFDNDFDIPSPPQSPDVKYTELDRRIILTWDDGAELNPGDYTFEGYNLYQSETGLSDWQRIATFDANDGILMINDIIFDDRVGQLIQSYPVQFGTDSGIRYSMAIDQDYILGGDLINNKPYYFAVSAYSYNLEATPKALETSILNVKMIESDGNLIPSPLIPRGDLPGHDYSSLPDTAGVLATHVSGNSDGSVTYEIVNPKSIDAGTYRVTFTIDDEGTTLWHLADPAGNFIWENQTNLSGDDLYLACGGPDDNGMVVKAMGPPFQANDWDYESSGDISPIYPDYADGRWFSGGNNHLGEIFFTGVYLEPNFGAGSSNVVARDEYRRVELRFTPMTDYTDTNGDGEFTICDPYEWDYAQGQNAFMYTGWGAGNFGGFSPIPFTAWEVDEVDGDATPRQLNIVIRDRNANNLWDLHVEDGEYDTRFNYVWICTTDYDESGALYDPDAGGLDLFAPNDAAGFSRILDGWAPAYYTCWFDPRGARPFLAEGGTFTITPNYVITEEDAFEFTLEAPKIDDVTLTKEQLDDILVVPNPYYAHSAYELDQFGRVVKFTHLPHSCKVRIFTIAGDLLRTLEKSDDEPELVWNLRTEHSFPVASGMYIYHVEAYEPDTENVIGTKIGKMGVLMEEERLNKY